MVCAAHNLSPEDLVLDSEPKTRVLDGRGRLSIPKRICEELGISGHEGRVCAIVTYDTDCVAIFVGFTGIGDNLSEVALEIVDVKGSLAQVAGKLSSRGFDIVKSDKRILIKGRVSLWNITLDVSNFLKDNRVMSDNVRLVNESLKEEIESWKPWVLKIEKLEYPFPPRRNTRKK